MNFGRTLRILLMGAFLIPGFLLFFTQTSEFILFFVLSLVFWIGIGGLISRYFARLLIRFSLWAEGTDKRIHTNGPTHLMTLLQPAVDNEEGKKKNRCLLLSPQNTANPHTFGDMLERAFFPTSLVIGVVALYMMFFDFIGLSGFLRPGHPILILIYVLSPGLVSLIVIPLWLVNDTRARIFHMHPGELRRIGETLKNVINAIAGLGALLRLTMSLFIGATFAIWVIVFFVIPLPIFLTTILYLSVFHSKNLTLVETVLEDLQ